jgi:hypothetical protein
MYSGKRRQRISLVTDSAPAGGGWPRSPLGRTSARNQGCEQAVDGQQAGDPDDSTLLALLTQAHCCCGIHARA